MRKDLGKKMNFLPLPVLMIGTYDKDGKANVMNAAWGGAYMILERFIFRFLSIKQLIIWN